MGNSVQSETWLWLAQRMSAVVLGVCVCVHIATMIIATQQGLSTAAIASRVGDSYIWLVFYSMFVTSVAIHAPIGIRSILLEVTGFPPKRVGLLSLIFGLFILAFGLRAVFGLYGLSL